MIEIDLHLRKAIDLEQKARRQQLELSMHEHNTLHARLKQEDRTMLSPLKP